MVKFEYSDYHKIASNDELIADLKAVAKELNVTSLSMQEYDQNGTYSSSAVTRRFGTWNKALSIAGLDYRNKTFTNEELFENLEKVWIKLGKQPTRRNMDDTGLSAISSGAYSRRFRNWSNALKAFIAYINETDSEYSCTVSNNSSHKTKRDVNLRMRFIVMQRDNFKCCACGASPATDPTITLHVDHIIPWSRGGETTIDNLQTYCSKCNLGKGNYISD